MTVLVNELLDSVVDNGPAKPKVVGILSFGTPNSSHPQTFWGDKQPHSVGSCRSVLPYATRLFVFTS